MLGDPQQQLQQALRARKTLEDTYESQFQTLALLVSRLSLACKGIDAELDNRLAKLRAELKRGTDLEKLTQFIDSTSENLKYLGAKHVLEFQKVQLALSEAGKLLQAQKGLPDNLRRNLRKLLSDIKEPTPTVQAFLPLMNQLIALYEQALHAKLQPYNSPNEQYQKVCQELSAQLATHIDSLSFATDSADELESIRVSLVSSALPIDALLQASVKTLSILIKNVSNERLVAQNFLLTLNDALSGVQQAVLTSLSVSADSKKQMQQINVHLSQQIDSLSKESIKATSLVQLKDLVTDKLVNLTNTLKQKELLENQDHERLQTNLTKLESHIRVLEEQAEHYKKRLNEQLAKNQIDALTEIPNRAAFDVRYKQEIKRALRNESNLSIVLADIDHFKNINDSYGHSAGDKTLRVIAQALQSQLRETDFIARYGGEEFVLLFTNTNEPDLDIILNKLREKIKRIAFRFKGEDVPITLSFGATHFVNTDSSTSAFDRADEALYAAKKAGRDKVVIKTIA